MTKGDGDVPLVQLLHYGAWKDRLARRSSPAEVPQEKPAPLIKVGAQWVAGKHAIWRSAFLIRKYGQDVRHFVPQQAVSVTKLAGLDLRHLAVDSS